MRATLSRNGRKTTTRVARIRRSTTRHRRPLPPNSPQQAITLRSVMAPRAGLLLTPPERAYSCRDSNPRWGILQWQVRWHPARSELNQVNCEVLGVNHLVPELCRAWFRILQAQCAPAEAKYCHCPALERTRHPLSA